MINTFPGHKENAGTMDLLANDAIRWVGGHKYELFDFSAHAVSKLWHPTPDLRQEIDRIQGNLSLDRPLCAFHVRRGDKLTAGEAQAHPLNEYVEKALRSGVQCKTCFVTSDHPDVVLPEFSSLVADYLPGCNVQTIDVEPLTRAVKT